MLPFKSDFFKTLERHGRLPATSLEAKLKTSTALDRIRSGLKIKQDISSMDEPQLKLFLRDSLNVGTMRSMSMHSIASQKSGFFDNSQIKTVKESPEELLEELR